MSMGRKKVKLEFIENDTTRRATLKKRGKGLQKKVSELSTLCGVDACLIVYGGEDGSSSKPEVWPPAPETRRVIERFRSMPELEQYKKMLDQEGMMRGSVAKLQEKLRQVEQDNRKHETTLLLHDAIAGRRPGLAGLTIQQVVNIGWMLEERVKKVRDRLAYMRRGQQQGVQLPVQPPPPHATAGLDPDAAAYSSGGSSSGSGSYGSVGAGGDMNYDAGYTRVG